MAKPLPDQSRFPTLQFDSVHWKKRNQRTIYLSILKRYPRTPEESTWLPKRIRLARHVPPWTCEACPLASEDHTEAGHWPSNVCLLDLRRKLKAEISGKPA